MQALSMKLEKPQRNPNLKLSRRVSKLHAECDQERVISRNPRMGLEVAEQRRHFMPAL